MFKKTLRQNFEKMNRGLKENAGLTGPHHVGAEVDLEFQASFNAAWRGFSKVFLFAALAAAAGWYFGGPTGPCFFLAGFSVSGSILSHAMSATLASRALTEAHPALKAVIGPTGGWSPVTGPFPDIELPDGRVLKAKDLQPAEQASTVTFERYSVQPKKTGSEEG